MTAVIGPCPVWCDPELCEVENSRTFAWHRLQLPVVEGLDGEDKVVVSRLLYQNDEVLEATEYVGMSIDSTSILEPSATAVLTRAGAALLAQRLLEAAAQ